MQILCLSTIDWDFLWQRHHAFMRGFAESGHNVFFVENTGFRNPSLKDAKRIIQRIKGILRRESAGPVGKNPVPARLRVITPRVLPPNGTVFRWVNRKILIPRLVEELGASGMGTPDVAFVYLPSRTTLEILNQVNPKRIIFDYVANFQGHPDCPSDFNRTELELLNKTDLVLTDSTFLRDYLVEKHPNVQQLHHGVDVGLFQQSAHERMPADYRSICFFGAIDDRIDWAALLALRDCGAKVTLIGYLKTQIPEGIEIRAPLSYDQLAREVQQYDAFVIPYKVTDFTNGIVPAKLYECMATGKPILMSNIPAAALYTDVLYICETPKQYADTFLTLGVTEDKRKFEKRRAIARAQSTKANFNELHSLVASLLVSKE